MAVSKTKAVITFDCCFDCDYIRLFLLLLFIVLIVFLYSFTATSDEDKHDGTVTYDRLLPTTHSYMNVENFQEFSGVCLLSDDRRCLLNIVEAHALIPCCQKRAELQTN